MAVVMEKWSKKEAAGSRQEQLHKLNNLIAKDKHQEQQQQEQLKSQSAQSAAQMPIGSCRHHVKQPGSASIQVYTLSKGPFRSIWLCFCFSCCSCLGSAWIWVGSGFAGLGSAAHTHTHNFMAANNFATFRKVFSENSHKQQQEQEQQQAGNRYS